MHFAYVLIRHDCSSLGLTDDPDMPDDEQLEVLQKLWTGEMVEHQGEFYRFAPIRMLPRPPERIPIYVGGTSEAAFRRAARHDGWEGAVYRWSEIEGYVQTSQLSNMRQFTASNKGKMLEVMRPMMMNKVAGTDTMQMIMKCAYDLLGGDGVIAPTEDELDTWGRKTTSSGWVLQYIFSMGPSIAGGASNIQRNIIGERLLGLPRDLRQES